MCVEYDDEKLLFIILGHSMTAVLVEPNVPIKLESTILPHLRNFISDSLRTRGHLFERVRFYGFILFFRFSQKKFKNVHETI